MSWLTYQLGQVVLSQQSLQFLCIVVVWAIKVDVDVAHNNYVASIIGKRRQQIGEFREKCIAYVFRSRTIDNDNEYVSVLETEVGREVNARYVVCVLLY